MKRIVNKSIVLAWIISITCPPLSSQPLTEAQRLERCQTFKKRGLEIHERFADINSMMFKKRSEPDLRDRYGDVHVAINNDRIDKDFVEVSGRRWAATKYSLYWQDSWENNSMEFQKALRKKLAEDIKIASNIDSVVLWEELKKLNAEYDRLSEKYEEIDCGKLLSGKKVEKNEQEAVKVNDGLDQKEPVKLQPIDQKSSGNEQSQKTKELGEEQNQLKTDKAVIGWTGTWEASNTTVTISGSQNSISAEFDYLVSDAKGTGGRWENCKVSSGMLGGKYAECKWTIHHEDKTKKGKRSGRLEVELKGDEITGTYYEDEPEFTYNEAEGYTKENVNTSMRKGVTWPISLKRKKGN